MDKTFLALVSRTSVLLSADHTQANVTIDLAGKRLASRRRMAEPASDLLDDALARSCPIAVCSNACAVRQCNQDHPPQNEDTMTTGATGV
jgi:hypothetical protein